MDLLTPAPVATPPTREDGIEEVLRTTAVERVEAEFIVALRHDEVDGDIHFTRLPGAEERCRMGLDPLADNELDNE